MPSIREMFESKYLSFHDLRKAELVYVTVRGVVPYQAQARLGGPPQPVGGVPAQGARVETNWLLWFNEFTKPLFLKKNRASKIAAILSSEDTDDWVGKRLGIYRGVWSNGGESGEGIMIDDRPVPASPRQASAAMSAPRRMAPIPPNAMNRFVGMITEEGQTWGDFLAWLKGQDLAAAGACYGQDMAEIPGLALPWMKAYLDFLHGPDAADPAAAPGPAPAQLPERVDAFTGEVFTAPSAAPAAAAPVERPPAVPAPASRVAAPPAGTTARRDPHTPPMAYTPLTEEDIPF